VKKLLDKDLLKKLLKDGWNLERIHGSHHVLKKGNKTEIVAVHGKDVPTGTLHKILKRTGLK
jgi:predicted RNA binding protein YcfA (HicA-like mRNA interferase family)